MNKKFHFYLLRFTNPNFAYSDRALSTSIESTVTDKEQDYGYKSSLNAVSIGTSYEQYEDLFFSPSLSISNESLTTTSLASANYKKQEGSYFDTYLNYSLDYDLRNQRYRATDGYRTTFYQELPLISESHEIVNAFGATKYQPLVSDMVGKLSFSVKAVNTITDNDVRVSKRLFIPERQLRGFERGKVGPVENNDFIGGNYVSTFNLSTTLPQLLPSFQNTDISVFFDAANIWGVDYNSSLDDNSKIRSATGVALDLLTPIGPLNFSLSQPISKASTDITESFRFNLGTTF